MFLEKSFIVASIMSIKNKYFQEKYVTYREVNLISGRLQEKFNFERLDVCITDDIDKNFFDMNDVILLNKSNDVSLKNIEDRYQSYCYSMEIFNILWNDEYMLDLILEVKKKELEKCMIDRNKRRVLIK